MSRRITYDGSTEYKNEQGLFHREDGPAIEYTDGAKEWRQYGKLHRLDGPAIDYDIKNRMCYIYGVYIKKPIVTVKCFHKLNNLLKLTVLQNKSRKFNEWLFDPDHYAGKWHKKNMLRDFQDS